ncbi:Gag-Pol polyprotein [Merluccius polli]|uniref:Gag-Pol polyprotein n=1 Tax=Merluccius polli TaxID=89951 RepID=A0AA47MWZ4_MERPO|nr:Gag-Pol polyprotein [Merluccius polli]
MGIKVVREPLSCYESVVTGRDCEKMWNDGVSSVSGVWWPRQSNRGPLEVVAVDFTTLERTSDGQENVLVVTDIFSKFTQAYPTPNQKACTVARVLTEKWFYIYGVPQRIHSDQGRSFESDLLKNLCKLYGVQKSRTTPYHPE